MQQEFKEIDEHNFPLRDLASLSPIFYFFVQILVSSYVEVSPRRILTCEVKNDEKQAPEVTKTGTTDILKI